VSIAACCCCCGWSAPFNVGAPAAADGVAIVSFHAFSLLILFCSRRGSSAKRNGEGGGSMCRTGGRGGEAHRQQRRALVLGRKVVWSSSVFFGAVAVMSSCHWKGELGILSSLRAGFCSRWGRATARRIISPARVPIQLAPPFAPKLLLSR
jgi:hypothetical protein